MELEQKCWICKRDAVVQETQDAGIYHQYSCDVCGKYYLNYAIACQIPKGVKESYILSGIARNRTFLSEKIKMPNYLRIDEEYLKNFEADNKDNFVPVPTTAMEKLDHFVYVLRDLSKHPGFEISLFPPNDYAFCFCKNKDEFEFYLGYLVERGFIVSRNNNPFVDVTLTIHCWEYLAELETTNKDSNSAFIAVNFSREDKYNKLIIEGIKPAVEKAKYKPIIINELDHENPESNTKIDDRIIVEIKRARFVVADFSGQRPNVYYEAGFARGLGLKVINCCIANEVDEKKLHFDTDHYPHLKWEEGNLTSFSENLYNRIVAEIGEGNYIP